MRYLGFFCFLFVCIGGYSQPKTFIEKKRAAADIAQIERLTHAWVQAEDFLDTLAISKILDTSFIAIGAEGVSDRQQELSEVYAYISRQIKNGLVVDSFRVIDMTIKLQGNAAIATYIVLTHGKAKGHPFVRRSRFYDVLVRRDGEWKAAASHVIRLPTRTAGYKAIESRSALWNETYNGRDSTAFYSLLDSSVIFTSGGGRQVGKEECKDICRKLWQARPDITWENQQTTIEVNEEWGTAFETGNWAESWTEKGDSERSEIKGKYCLMWKVKEKEWVITSAIFTPLSCSGSYCTKNKAN